MLPSDCLKTAPARIATSHLIAVSLGSMPAQASAEDFTFVELKAKAIEAYTSLGMLWVRFHAPTPNPKYDMPYLWAHDGTRFLDETGPAEIQSTRGISGSASMAQTDTGSITGRICRRHQNRRNVEWSLPNSSRLRIRGSSA